MLLQLEGCKVNQSVVINRTGASSHALELLAPRDSLVDRGVALLSLPCALEATPLEASPMWSPITQWCHNVRNRAATHPSVGNFEVFVESSAGGTFVVHVRSSVVVSLRFYIRD
jgi:hypothetical protein